MSLASPFFATVPADAWFPAVANAPKAATEDATVPAFKKPRRSDPLLIPNAMIEYS